MTIHLIWSDFRESEPFFNDCFSKKAIFPFQLHSWLELLELCCNYVGPMCVKVQAEFIMIVHLKLFFFFLRQMLMNFKSVYERSRSRNQERREMFSLWSNCQNRSECWFYSSSLFTNVRKSLRCGQAELPIKPAFSLTQYSHREVISIATLEFKRLNNSH